MKRCCYTGPSNSACCKPPACCTPGPVGPQGPPGPTFFTLPFVLTGGPGELLATQINFITPAGNVGNDVDAAGALGALLTTQTSGGIFSVMISTGDTLGTVTVRLYSHTPNSTVPDILLSTVTLVGVSTDEFVQSAPITITPEPGTVLYARIDTTAADAGTFLVTATVYLNVLN